MKICFVVSTYPRDHNDLEVPWLRETVNRLREQGHDIIIYAPSYKGLHTHKIDGCRVYRFRYFFAPFETLTHDEGAPNKLHKFHYKIIMLFYIFCGTIGLMGFHFKEKFDILHVHWPAPHGLFAFFASLVRKTKIVLSFYTASLMLVKKFPFVRHFLKFFIKHANEIIAISNFTSKLASDIYSEKPIHIIPYGTTVSPKTSIDMLKPNHHIFSMGRMVERKGFEYLIRAMPEILSQWPDAKLTIAGGGALQNDLISLTQSLKIEKSVSIPGKVSDEERERLFMSCNVFVLPSIIDSKGDTEGLGVVLLEAMTCFKPVVGSNVGGITDIIIPEKSGILVPQKDPKAIANAVHLIFSEHEMAKKLAVSGYEYIQGAFSWESVTKKFNDVYKLVL